MSRKSNKKVSSYCSLPEEIVNSSKNVIVKGIEYSSLQHIQQINEPRTFAKLAGRRFPLSSDSDELLVLPPGVITYYSTESEEMEDKCDTEKNTPYDFSELKDIAVEMRKNFSQVDLHFKDNNVKESEANPICKSTEVQSGSLGSSENTDSAKTVLDAEYKYPYDEAIAAFSDDSHPNFQLGGEMSSQSVKVQEMQNVVRNRMSQYKLTLDCSSNPTSLELYDDKQFVVPLIQNSNEQDMSLTSQIPESSDRCTSPSVMSVSSLASSRPLEWDSAADVGYSRVNVNASSTSLSTLERITLSKCASTILGEEGSKYSNYDHRNKKQDRYRLGGRSQSQSDVPNMKKQMLQPELQFRKPKVPYIPPSTSSEENLSKVSNTSQSPRRKLRKRSTVLSDSKDHHCCSKTNKYNSTKNVDSIKFNTLNELRNDRIKPVIMKHSHRFDNKYSSSDKIESHGVLSEESGSTVMFSAKSINSADEENEPVRPSIDHQDEGIDTTALELTQYPIDSPSTLAHQSPPSNKDVKDCPQAGDTSILQPPADNPEAINEFLKVLSLKLKKHLDNLVEKEVGVEAKESVQYHKLVEYINFVGLETTSVEHVKKRQDVAELIVEMCGEVQARHELKMQDVLIDEEPNTAPVKRCATPVESEGLVAYKPRPSGDLYYMAVPSGTSAMPDSATSSLNVPITQSLPEIVAPGAPFKFSQSKQQQIEQDKIEREKEANQQDATAVKCLVSATSQSSLNVDCSCAGGYSASHSSLHSHTSTSDPSEPTSFSNFREQQSLKHISASSCKNMSSFEVERELASIMGQVAPRRVSQMPPVADGRQVHLDSAPNFDSSLNCSLPEQRRTVDTSEFPVDLPSNEGAHYNVGENALPVRPKSTLSPSNDEGEPLSHELEERPEVVCSSSCSESAYETIRSKDRHMDEALASSFEFYCTVSKNARAVGYISSSEQDNDVTDAKFKSSSKDGVASSLQKCSSNEVRERRGGSSQNHPVKTDKSSKDSSARGGKKEDSKQMQRRKYVKQIQRCANILGKLEENLSVFSVEQRPLEGKSGTYSLKDRRKETKLNETKTSSGGSSHTNTTNSQTNSSKEKSSAISRVVSSPWYGELTQSSYNSLGGLSQMEKEVAKLKELQSRVGSAASSNRVIHPKDEVASFKIVHGDSELENNESFVSDLENHYYQDAGYEYGGPNVVNMKIASSETSGKGSYKTEDSAIVPGKIRPGTKGEEPTRMRVRGRGGGNPLLLGMHSNRVSAFKSIPKGEKSFPPLSSSEFMSENVPLMTSTFRGKRQSFDSEVKTNKIEVSSFAERDPLKADDIPSGKGIAPPKITDHRGTEGANFGGKEERTSVKQNVERIRDKRIENIGIKKDFGQTYPSPIITSERNTAVQTGKSLLGSRLESTFKPVVTGSKYDSSSSEISNLINKRCGVPITDLHFGDKPILKPRAARAPLDFIIRAGQEERNRTPPSSSTSSSSLFTPHTSKGNRVAEARKQYSTRRAKAANKENEVPVTTPVPLIGADIKAMTLQEALRRSRPDFINKADNRREKIVRHQNIRKEAYQYNAELLTNIPATMHQPDTINKLLYRPVMSPVVPYKEMRQHTKKVLSKLPEVTKVNQRRERAVLAHTNRLRQQLYSRKLVSKAVQGKVAHGHDNVCTPSR